MDSLTITADSLRLVSDSLNYFMKVLPEIKQQISILKPLIICLSFLLLIDFLTGVRKAKSLKQKIHSGGFRRSINKMNDYCLAIIASQIFTWMLNLEFTLSYYVALFVCGIELKSIFENVSQTTGVDIIGYFKGFIPNPKDILKKPKGDNPSGEK
jgi:phage-related holin